MPCDPIRRADGGVVGFACTRGKRPMRCSEPGCGAPCDILCDFPLSGEKAGQTCDRSCCAKHSTKVGKNRDYCNPHTRQAAKANAGDAEEATP